MTVENTMASSWGKVSDKDCFVGGSAVIDQTVMTCAENPGHGVKMGVMKMGFGAGPYWTQYGPIRTHMVPIWAHSKVHLSNTHLSSSRRMLDTRW